jgi:hypothetical protein
VPEDAVLAIIIVVLAAVCAYACTGSRKAFSSLASRLRWSAFFFAIFMTAFVLFSWDKISAILVSN